MSRKFFRGPFLARSSICLCKSSGACSAIRAGFTIRRSRNQGARVSKWRRPHQDFCCQGDQKVPSYLHILCRVRQFIVLFSRHRFASKLPHSDIAPLSLRILGNLTPLVSQTSESTLSLLLDTMNVTLRATQGDVQSEPLTAVADAVLSAASRFPQGKVHQR